MVMIDHDAFAKELARLERTACALTDALSQEALRDYVRQVEYDLRYGARSQEPDVTI